MGFMVLKCDDFGYTTPCCIECAWALVVYPPGVFADKTYRPDLGMGIRGELCCKHLHNAQMMPRHWWYEKYLRDSKRFLETEIQQALKAPQETYYRIYGEIHAAARAREFAGYRLIQGNRRAPKPKKCPECGGIWDESVCINCGFYFA